MHPWWFTLYHVLTHFPPQKIRMIISIDAEIDAFYQIQHPCTIALWENSNRREYPQQDKEHPWKPWSQHCTKWWKNECATRNPGDKRRLFDVTSYVQHRTLDSSQWDKPRKKATQIGKKEVKLSLFAGTSM